MLFLCYSVGCCFVPWARCHQSDDKGILHRQLGFKDYRVVFTYVYQMVERCYNRVRVLGYDVFLSHFRTDYLVGGA